MLHCEYCNAPLLSITKVCPNCHREQPPYPPVLPGGGGKSYSGWAVILVSIGALSLILAVAMFFQAPYSNPAAWIYGSPNDIVNNNTPTYLFPDPDGGGGIYPGYGYLFFFGGITVLLWLWAFVSYNRGRAIDRANRRILQSLQRSANGR